MESGFLYPEAVFPFSARRTKQSFKCVDVFADDVIETVNHFRCIDMIIDNVKVALTEKFIKELHLILKNGTTLSIRESVHCVMPWSRNSLRSC